MQAATLWRVAIRSSLGVVLKVPHSVIQCRMKRHPYIACVLIDALLYLGGVQRCRFLLSKALFDPCIIFYKHSVSP